MPIFMLFTASGPNSFDGSVNYFNSQYAKMGKFVLADAQRFSIAPNLTRAPLCSRGHDYGAQDIQLIVANRVRLRELPRYLRDNPNPRAQSMKDEHLVDRATKAI